MNKLESQIQQLKTDYAFQSSATSSTPTFGNKAKLNEQVRSKTISLGDGSELPYEKVEHLLKDGGDIKDRSVFLMQARLHSVGSLFNRTFRVYFFFLIAHTSFFGNVCNCQ